MPFSGSGYEPICGSTASYPKKQESVLSDFPDLPVRACLPNLVRHLHEHPCCLLEAPPGAGKTTLVPLALLTADWLSGQKIVVLEPRRMAARNAARQMARILGEVPGQTVGYHIRLERKVTPQTRIIVITEGILTRLLQRDPELRGIGCILFDEFHERNIHADLGLTLALDCQIAFREDLRLLIMSATLDSEPLQLFLKQIHKSVPLVRCDGKQWPVETFYCPADSEQKLEVRVALHIKKALAKHSGSILVFLPGAGEIKRTAALLSQLPPEILVYPLYGDLPAQDQDRALQPAPAGKRKIVLSTSIAESSLTIEGIRVVIDAGLARTLVFDPGTGLTRLVTRRETIASADQRRGRAGRTEPGICYRLWHPGEETGMRPFQRPEILESDMAPLCLELAAWGIQNPAALHWMTPPPTQGFLKAQELLRHLGALDGKGRITPLGQQMIQLPVHPRLARMLIKASEHNLGGTACLLAALAEERNPLQTAETDISLRMRFVQESASPQSRRIRDAARQIARLCGVSDSQQGSIDYESTGSLLALAYPDRIALARTNGTFVLASGQGAYLPPHDQLRKASVLAVSEVHAESGNLRIRQAAQFSITELERLYPHEIKLQDTVFWDNRTESVIAQRQQRYGALVLFEQPLGVDIDEDAAIHSMLDGLRQMGLHSLPWTPQLENLRERIRFMRLIEPNEAWPDCSDTALLENLETWLAPFLCGIRRREHLKRIPLTEALRFLLPGSLLQKLDREAPEDLLVPSGRSIPLDYTQATAEHGPALAVKLQECFGMTRTPRVAHGKIPIRLHLLSPAGRPLQITSDIEGFWKSSYFAVRAEMRGRYPKHPWPENPLTALPTRKTKARST